MAVIKFSPLVIDVRNSVGDTVYSAWKGVHYIRSRVVPANPRTADQVKQREIMTSGVTNWQSLGSTLQDAWNTWASEYSISGFNAFVARNVATAIPNGDGTAARMEVACTLPPALMRATAGGPEVQDFAATTGTTTGQIKVEWDNSGWFSTDKLHIAAWAEDGITYYQAPAFGPHAADMDTGTYVITGLEANKPYTVAAIAWRESEDAWSVPYGAKNVTAAV